MTEYVFVALPFATVIVTVFSPDCHVAAVPFSTSAPFTTISTIAFSSIGVAVIVLVALLVVAV
jgi:hypothetical protein